jgi:hypothetical protein
VKGWRDVAGGSATISNPASGGNTGGSGDGYLAWTTNDSGRAGGSPTDESTWASTDTNLDGNLWTKYGSDIFVTFDVKVDGSQEISNYDVIMSNTSSWGTWTQQVTLPTPQTSADGWVTHKHRLTQSWDDATAEANGWQNAVYWGSASDFSSFMEITNYAQVEVFHLNNEQATGGLDNFGFEAGDPVPLPTSFTWNLTGLGDWHQGGSWTPGGGPPNSDRHTAVFGGNIIGASTVLADDPVTVNRIEFNSSKTYAIAGLGGINLVAETGDSMTLPTIAVSNQGSHQFQTIVNLLDDTTADAASNSTLNFNNQINTNGNALNLTGAGVVNLNHSVIGGGAVSGSGTLGTASNTSLGGDLTSTGTLAIEIRGTGEGSGSVPTDFSRFDVSGAANLDGAVDINLVDFTPAAGTNFTILTTTNGINFVGGSTGIGDLNLTGNSTDFSLALGNGGNDLVLSYLATGGVAGDFNGNGIVDAADYTVFRDNLGGDSAVLNGNGSGAATVVQADYDLWKQNFGSSGTGTGSSAAVPEPSAACLLILGGLVTTLARLTPSRHMLWHAASARRRAIHGANPPL